VPDTLSIEMIPKGSGSENGSFLKMAIPAEGVDAIKTFVIDCVLAAGGKTCPPTIVGVGLGGTSDLVVALAKRAATRPLGSACADPDGAALERSCRRPSTCWASARRAWAATRPRSPCTSNWPPRTSR
jgi:fumarate hydratase subunit alpha/L(+)-tartrate dehydratase alpha subunit